MPIDKSKITKEEAAAYLSELENMELDSKDLDKVAGGFNDCYSEHCSLFTRS